MQYFLSARYCSESWGYIRVKTDKAPALHGVHSPHLLIPNPSGESQLGSPSSKKLSLTSLLWVRHHSFAL